ncbi:hypothetical protein CN468_19970 [Bacillus cereus]|uniref:hypothetical protein n=1 Tax=Bacillus cereus TaxID=1396 RepID=UPI000BF79CCB|nr:hypothetical protein [Bacillus cereus]PEQ47809.1 hypothetical protein CN468_19970 [Bacillus cereus]PFB60414.1 hypothetical protein CN291_25680 [Bacillus cereus]PFD67544.1 hypothetical protein CN301_27455 [Bacillus cereus]
MDFRVYQVIYPDDLTQHGQALYEFLGAMAKQPGEHRFEYCITNDIDYSNDIITFCLSEEYQSNISSVDDNKNAYVPEVSPYLSTCVALDLQEKRLLVQHRDYPPDNLSKDTNMTRLSLMLNQAFESVCNAIFNYLDTSREADDEDFAHIFRHYRVTMLRVKLFETGRYISEETQLFDNEVTDEHWKRGWAEDGSSMHEVILKAPGRGGEGDLRESPIAKSLINLVRKDVMEINYWDDDGVSESLSRADFRRFSIAGINIHTLAITAIQTISNEVYNRRGEVRRFIATREFE